MLGFSWEMLWVFFLDLWILLFGVFTGFELGFPRFRGFCFGFCWVFSGFARFLGTCIGFWVTGCHRIVV